MGAVVATAELANGRRVVHLRCDPCGGVGGNVATGALCPTCGGVGTVELGALLAGVVGGITDDLPAPAAPQLAAVAVGDAVPAAVGAGQVVAHA